MSDTSKITLGQLKTALAQAKNYTDNEIAGVTGISKVEPEELDMPKVFFYGNALPTTKDNVNLTMDYVSNTDKFTSYVKLKCQGTSSMSYAKKNFTLSMFEDADRSLKLNKDFKGWGAQSKFCLKANYVDTTHTRNLAGARIGYDIVKSRPDSAFKQQLLSAPRCGLVDGFPIKLYFNGEFYGIYTWNIPKDGWMFNMDKSNPNHIVLCAERNTDGNASLSNSCQFKKLWTDGDGGDWSVEFGTYSTDLQSKFNRVIAFVKDSTDEEFKANISQYLDLYSVIDYYCFSYLCCHLDGLAKNMLMVTYDGNIWGCSLYDMDSIFGVQWNGQSYVASNYQCPEQYQEQFSLLWPKIERCFGRELYQRYLELRRGALSLSNIVKHVEEIYDVIPDRVFKDEQSKWTSLPQVNANTMTRFRNYMKDRAAYVDAQMEEIGSAGNAIPCTGITLNKNTLELDGSGTSNKISIRTNLLENVEWKDGLLDDMTGNISNGSDKYATDIIIDVPGIYNFTSPSTYSYKKIVVMDDNDTYMYGHQVVSGTAVTDGVLIGIYEVPAKIKLSILPDSNGLDPKLVKLTEAYPIYSIPEVYDRNIPITDEGQINIRHSTTNYHFIELYADAAYKNIASFKFNNKIYKIASLNDKSISSVNDFALNNLLNTNNLGYSYSNTWGSKSLYYLVIPRDWGETAADILSYITTSSITLTLNPSDTPEFAINIGDNGTDIITTWEQGYINRNKTSFDNGTIGTINTDSSYDVTSDFIDVSHVDSLNFQLNQTGYVGAVGYDINKNVVCAWQPNSNGYNGKWVPYINKDAIVSQMVITYIPEEVYYVRVCFNITNPSTQIKLMKQVEADNVKPSKYRLVATVTPSDTTENITWRVSPIGIVSVDNGLVTAKANGSAVITATCGTQSANCAVTVSGMSESGGESTGPTRLEAVMGAFDTNSSEVTSNIRARTAVIPLEITGDSFNFSCSSTTWEFAFKLSDNTGNVTGALNFVINENLKSDATDAWGIPNGNYSTGWLNTQGGTVSVNSSYCKPSYVRMLIRKGSGSNTFTIDEIKDLEFSINGTSYKINKTEPASSLLYELPQETTFNGTSDYIDTGVALLSTDQDFTIVLDVIASQSQTNSQSTLVHCMHEVDPYPGLSIMKSGDDSGFYIPRGSNASMIGLNPNLIPKNIRTKVVITKEGTAFNAYSSNGFAGSSTYTHSQVNENLLIGAYQQTNGDKGRYFSGTVYDFKIYNKVFTSQEKDSYLDIRTRGRVFKIDSTCMNTESNTLIDSVAGISATLTGNPTVSDNQIVFTANDTFSFDISSLGLTYANRTFRIKFTPTTLDTSLRNVIGIGSSATWDYLTTSYVTSSKLVLQHGNSSTNGFSGNTVGSGDSADSTNRLSTAPVTGQEYELVISEHINGNVRWFVDGTLVQDGTTTHFNPLYISNVEGSNRFVGSYSLIEIYDEYCNNYAEFTNMVNNASSGGGSDVNANYLANASW